MCETFLSLNLSRICVSDEEGIYDFPYLICMLPL